MNITIHSTIKIYKINIQKQIIIDKKEFKFSQVYF